MYNHYLFNKCPIFGYVSEITLVIEKRRENETEALISD